MQLKNQGTPKYLIGIDLIWNPNILANLLLMLTCFEKTILSLNGLPIG